MNVLLLLSVLTLTAVTFADDDDYSYDDDYDYDLDDDLVKVAQMVVKCGEQLSLDEYTLEMILEQKLQGTEQSNCFLKCMLVNLKIINEKGEVQLDNYHEVIPKDDPIKGVMAQCQHVVVATCDDALTLEKCNENIVLGKVASILRK